MGKLLCDASSAAVTETLKPSLTPRSCRWPDASPDPSTAGGLRGGETAAESIYKERCILVNDGPSWAKYMSISGSPEDEHDIITLQYTEEGLLSVDENQCGHAAAFGDDIAIESLASEFKREVYVIIGYVDTPIVCTCGVDNWFIRQVQNRFKPMDQMLWLTRRTVYSSSRIVQGVKFVDLQSFFS
ncbi:uncharacterized protein A4U43_C09F13930 [Asparagus officinalis]|uniref:Uncharacterized protein n=1 Tax=Asparagus officinalis TaxID=4686 RepID=A0A5P1E7B5_ASPOF|nr:uncharacterized protein A4U43_C09F13930 [Asparagus officinalis]